MINADEIAGNPQTADRDVRKRRSRDEIGTVIEVGANLARVYGLRGVRASELVEFPNGMQGVALKPRRGQRRRGHHGPDAGIKEGDLVRRTGRIASVPVGDALLGRVVNPLGEPVDGKVRSTASVFARSKTSLPRSWSASRQAAAPDRRSRDRRAHPDRQRPARTDHRRPFDRQDGDRGRHDHQSKGPQRLLHLRPIGQKNSTIAALAQMLEEKGAMEYTTIVTVGPSEARRCAGSRPFAGCAMGEELMYSGKDVLIIYDDLTKHAQSYREMSLLLAPSAGREAYPGDVFFLHSRCSNAPPSSRTRSAADP